MLVLKSQSDQAITLAQNHLALESTPPPNECEVSLWMKYNIGLAQQETRVYEECLTTLYDVILIARKNNFPRIEAESFLTIALVHEFLQDNAKCAENLKKAETLITKHDIKESYPRFCIRSSSYTRRVGNISQATEYAKEATIHAPKVNDITNEVDGYLLLGGFESDPVKAVEYFDKSVELSLSINKHITAATQTINSSVILARNFQLDLANKYLNKAYGIVQKFEEKNKDYYSVLSYYHIKKKELFVTKNQLDSALFHSERYASILSKTFTQTNTFALEETETKFELELEKQKAKQIIKNTKFQRQALYIGGLLLLLLGGLTYRLNKSKKQVKIKNQQILDQNAKLTKEKNKSNMLLSEIHHRVKNNLQNIISLIIFKNVDSKTEDEKTLLNDIKGKIMSLAITYENLYSSGEFDRVDVEDYLERFTTNYLSSNSNKLNFTTKVTKKHLNIETMIPIGLLISELCTVSKKCCIDENNILPISISLNSENESELVFEYQQKGMIYPEDIIEQTNTTTSINIIKSMCRQLKGEYQFYNTDDGCFQLKFTQKVISKV